MRAPVVVFAVGNPSRGDDALGPLLLKRLDAWLAAAGLAGEVELIEDFQLQIEHALDLAGRRLALFIDAGAQTPAPYHFRRIADAPGVAHTTHALPPAAVLRVYRQTEGGEPPPAFVLCVRGEGFELGAPPSAAATEHAGQALVLLESLLRRPELSFWESEQSEVSSVA